VSASLKGQPHFSLSVLLTALKIEGSLAPVHLSCILLEFFGEDRDAEFLALDNDVDVIAMTSLLNS
jgi:hypothetical protein